MVCFTTVDQSSVVLQTMFDTKKYMDVSFLAGPDKKIVKAHRSVLTAALEYFDAMFSSSFKENEDSTITLDGIGPEIIESIIKFLYCGVIEIPDMDTAFQLWEPCHMMQIKNLQEHILQYMKNNIRIKNCLGVYFMAKKYEEEELASLSMGFAVSKIEKVIDEDEILHLAKDHLAEFIKAAKEKDALENIIGKAALTWLKFNEQRQEHFKEILFLLDIEKIDDPGLIDDFESMCTDMEDVKYISKAIKTRCFNNRSLFHPKNNSPGDVVVIIRCNGKTKTISEFDVTSNVIFGEVNAHLNGTVLGTWNGTLILLNDNLSQITRYNIKTNASTDVGVYNIRNYLDSTILDNELYIVTVRHCYIIDLMFGRLLKILDCPPTYEFLGVTSCKKTIYFTVSKKTQQDLMYTYELRVAQYLRDTNLIEIVSTPKHFQYKFIKCIVHNDSITIFTGNGISVFDLVKKQWVHQAVSHSPISNAVSTKNKLIVIQNNALCEFNTNYHVIKLQTPFGSLKNIWKLFTLK